MIGHSVIMFMARVYDEEVSAVIGVIMIVTTIMIVWQNDNLLCQLPNQRLVGLTVRMRWLVQSHSIAADKRT